MNARQFSPEGRILLTARRDRLPDILKNLAGMEWAPESFKLGRKCIRRKYRQYAKR
jgi:hypothetical protein